MNPRSDMAVKERAAHSTPRERFDLGIAMLKAYYDALEGRLEKALATLVVVIGWLVTSDSARGALADSDSLLATATVTLSALVAMYVWSIVHWVRHRRLPSAAGRASEAANGASVGLGRKQRHLAFRPE